MHFIIEAVVIIIAGLILFSWIAIATQESFLEKLCENMPGEFYRKPREGGRSYSFRGKLQDRQILIRYDYPRFRIDPAHCDTALEVQIPVVQKFWLRLLPERFSHEFEDAVIEDELLEDQSFVAHSNQREAAAQFLSDPHIRQQFAMLGLLQRLEIHRGVLTARYVNAPAFFDHPEFQDALNALSQIVYWYERQAAFKITAITASPLCPYCRSRLDEKLEPVYECRQCHTRLHESCWKENRHCTTWGCNSSLTV